MKKYYIGLLVIFSLFLGFSIVRAEVGNNSADSSTNTNLNNPNSGSICYYYPDLPLCVPFTKTVKYGDNNNDVQRLQKFLNVSGYPISVQGAGSPGKETGYFGNATKQALIKFQKENKLGADGKINKKTIDYINKFQPKIKDKNSLQVNQALNNNSQPNQHAQGQNIGGSVVVPQASLDSFTTCLKDKGAVFYGTFWCPHCVAQKKFFGNSQILLPYVECSTPDGQNQTQVCTDKKIEGYPTWMFADNSILQGEVPLDKLASKTGCTLPEKLIDSATNKNLAQ